MLTTPITDVDIKKWCSPMLLAEPLWEMTVEAIQKAIRMYVHRYELVNYTYDFVNVPYNSTDSIYTDLPAYASYQEDMEHYRDYLIDFCKGYGYDPNLELVDDTYSILDTVRILQREAESIVWKIQHKGSLTFYEYMFKLYDFIGSIYVMLLSGSNTYKRFISWDDQTIYKPDGTVDYTILGAHNELMQHTIGDTFTKLIPYINLSSFLLRTLTFDQEGLTFDDEVEPWYFDQFIDTNPTPHMAIDFNADRLFTTNTGYALSTKNVLSYLRKFIEFGKKATVVPHIGVQLNIPITETFYYNFASSGYSIPDLMLNAVITNRYASYTATTLEYMDSGRTTDEAIVRYTDGDGGIFGPKVTSEIFDRLVVGIGSKTTPDYAYPNVLSDMVLFTSFDTNVVKDHSTNALEFTTTGSPILTHAGWSGKSWTLSGSEYAVSTNTASSPTSDYSVSFWASVDLADLTAGTQQEIWAWEDCQRFYIKNIAGTYSIIWGVIYDLNIEFTTTITELSGFIHCTIVTSGADSIFTMYYNNAILMTNTVTTPTSASGIVYVGCDTANTNCLIGSIADIRIQNKLLSTAEQTYLYTSKLGPLYSLHHQVYSIPIDQVEVRDVPTTYAPLVLGYRFVGASTPAFACNETIGVGAGAGTTTYTLTVQNMVVTPTSQLTPQFTRISYTSGGEVYILTDNGTPGYLDQVPKYQNNGTLIPSRCYGAVNYLNGQVSITTEQEHSHTDNVTLAEGPTDTFTGTIPDISVINNIRLKSATVNVSYNVAGTQYNVTANGSDQFPAGTYITSGSVNLTTGEVTITFNTTTTNVFVDYYTDIRAARADVGTDIDIEYRISSTDYAITEAGVVDINGDLVAYATFPPVNFNSVYDHLFTNFIIRNAG